MIWIGSRRITDCKNESQFFPHLVPFRGIDVGGESEPFRVSSTLPPNSITRDTITYFVDDQGVIDF